MNPVFKRWYCALVALQILLVGQLVVFKQITLWRGQHIVLKTTPVDPEDLFRGQFVALDYEFSHRAPDDLRDETYQSLHVKPHDTIYVALQRQGRFWVYNYASSDPPEKAPVFLKGHVLRTSPRVDIEYGIESYFVPRGEGPKLEAASRGPGAFLVVDVSVDRYGRAVLRGATAERSSRETQ